MISKIAEKILYSLIYTNVISMIFISTIFILDIVIDDTPIN